MQNLLRNAQSACFSPEGIPIVFQAALPPEKHPEASQASPRVDQSGRMPAAISASPQLRNEFRNCLKQKEERLGLSSLSCLLALLNVDDHAARVLSASAASAVRHAKRAAVGACDNAGCGELPGGRTSLIASLSRNLSFWDCHVDTS